MLIIELNEFNKDLLARAAEELSLDNIASVLAMSHATTMAEEKQERFGLDPWVQWVSIHTGLKAEFHQVRHLGDAFKLEYPQLWEMVAEKGKTYGVWGCMNARYSSNPGCHFFFPDPWTFTEQAYPENLNSFLALPRYYAKHYLDPGFFRLLSNASRSSLFMMRHLPALAPHVFPILGTLARSGINSISLFAIFDLINAVCFAQYREKYQSDLSIIFLNSVAHLQHHLWPGEGTLGKQHRGFFKLLDRTLGVILETRRNDEQLLLLNAFSQKNTADLEETLYRQKSPDDFFRHIGLKNFTTEQLMTNDSQLIFESLKDRENAEQIIGSIQVNNKPAFQVDRNEKNPLALFCQFILWEAIEDSAELKYLENRAMRFYDHFEPVTKRTGSHVRQGDVFFQGLELPKKLDNDGIAKYVLEQI